MEQINSYRENKALNGRMCRMKLAIQTEEERIAYLRVLTGAPIKHHLEITGTLTFIYHWVHRFHQVFSP